jgi:hypothetical protein
MSAYEPVASWDDELVDKDGVILGRAVESCGWDVPALPGQAIFASALLDTAGDTLRAGAHDHDDGLGAVGLCRGTPVPGAPYYRLIAAGFESDEDLDGSGSDADGALHPGFWRDDDPRAVGESGGRHAIYVDVVDENGAVLDRNTAPELRIVKRFHEGPTELIGIDAKGPDEFNTNIPMWGGQRIAISVEGNSDEVMNLRMPANHHVGYVLIFQRVWLLGD